MLCNDREMLVALGGCRFTCNGRYPGRDDDRRFWVTLGNSVRDDLAIVRSICSHRRNVDVDLIKEVYQFRDVADIIGRQFHRDEFMRVGIDTEMQLAPPAAGPEAVLLIEPFALAVNLQHGAIDQQMQRICAVNSPRQDRQAATAAAQCGVIGDGDVDLEHIDDRSEQTLGLSQRLVEYQAEREARLDGAAATRTVPGEGATPTTGRAGKDADEAAAVERGTAGAQPRHARAVSKENAGKRHAEAPSPAPLTGMQLHTADGIRKYLTAGERDAFLREADLADRPVRTLCMTLAYGGCRLSEALALTADRVDLAAGVLVFESLKKR
jgi:hypothetical protein